MLYLWQLPQNLVGLLIRLFYKGEVKHKVVGITFWYCPSFKGGISLGNMVMLGTKHPNSVKHEYGHSVQSKYLGWLYLIVIGLPSLLWAMFYKGNNYYSFFTEKWADKLGGVKR
jgi:hypothetical protein